MAIDSFQETTTYTEICCHACHARYGLDSEFARRRSEEGGEWTCPYCGRSTCYTETEVARLRRESQRLKDAIQCANNAGAAECHQGSSD